MIDFIHFEKSVLYPYYQYDESKEDSNDAVSRLKQKVVVGSYVEALQDEECQKALLYGQSQEARAVDSDILDFYRGNLSCYLKNGGITEERVVYCIGISCLQLFIQNNFCGPLIGPSSYTVIPGLVPAGSNEMETREKVMHELIFDTEGVYTLLSYPEYLIVARIVFLELRHSLQSCTFADWWLCRYGIIHQKIADEQSPEIFETLLSCLNGIEGSFVNDSDNRELSALFHLEAGHIYLYYYDIANAKVHFDKTLNILAMDVTLTGALGVRTKWQQYELAQLVVKVSYIDLPLTQKEQTTATFLPSDLPKDIVLNDDTRLNKISFLDVDEDVIPNLQPIEQMALFGHFLLKRKSQAHDEQLNEETKAYLWALLQFPKNWALQLSALVLRSRVESVEMRSMERALSQFEELVNAVTKEEPSRFERLKLIYASLLSTQWNLKQELARMYMRLGCVKTALGLFENLQLWEDVIVCYNELQMRQRSAEIIQRLLENKETPKLWCLMGDATDDITCYLKAWELSGYKSGRAQRCLGHYYYVRKNYEKAIEHFEQSVQINSLQFPVWQRLAYCALQTEDWEKCARAYTRCSILEPDNFESWNNMSQAYLKLGQLNKAWKSLEEALRCKIDNWRLWDNYMLVSTLLGYMNQALNAYNRILQYKEKHVDTEILGRIVQAILQDRKDPDGKPMNTLHKKCLELIGKLSREVPTNPELWFFYADLLYYSPDSSKEAKHTAMQYYRKSVAAETQKLDWEKDTNKTCVVLARILKLVEVAKVVSEAVDRKAALADLSSIRMLVRNTVTLIRKSQTNILSGELVEVVKNPLVLTEIELNNLNNLIDNLKNTNA